MPAVSRDGRVLYRERLRAPLRWWLLWGLMLASFWLAMIVSIPESLAWGITGVLLLMQIVLLTSYGSVKITVTDGWLHAGRARIERHHVGDVDILGAQLMRDVSGRDADARAFLVLRPYVATGVRICIADPGDPTPYWLVCSRRPEALAAALASRTGGPSGGPQTEEPVAG
ncbi:DUF3093 domain-containing protein [Nocardioides sp. Root190]|uniref:DUF3093 domain-containing protein n=1 Tax=Nocardioides sp. Root190 TaxID=1736488 RepID=UPI0009E89205|nr:DUF3093 domain-containing protein [Nocardioides sp. Root190]